jgi:hypothetical protein
MPLTLADWKKEHIAKRCAPPPWSFTGHFSLYTHAPKRTMRHLDLETLLKVPDLMARAERSGSEACYVEVIRWSNLRARWEKFAFEKCFGGEIKEFPDLGDTETCQKIADFINERMGTRFTSLCWGLPTFNSK